jgi:hypothetical protein
VADCAACPRPAPDATICPGCTQITAGHLRKVRWLVEQLELTLTRQARIGDRNGPRGRETPLVYDPRAAEAHLALTATLRTWANNVGGHRGVEIDEDSTSPVALARWLLRWNGAAAQHPHAGQYLDDLDRVIGAAQRVIDRAPDMRYIGPCDKCGKDMYVSAGTPTDRTVNCPTPDCDASYLLSDRRAWLLEQAYNRLLTANEMSRAIGQLIPGEGVRLTPNLISLWGTRGKITRYLPHARDKLGRTRYLVEEVIRELRAAGEKTRRTA